MYFATFLFKSKNMSLIELNIIRAEKLMTQKNILKQSKYINQF